ncbi:hypothetical protein FYK55_19805 [Roseiconus nitratireducens]|uniref:Secreted protein with PEP-CTERM sorting signal n=1 Tax=Roseiconus nitratireducens TaxID=2605748 RepID=A0A5M6D2Y0_9BACT|nr:hypothetical protein [Roseiconus nitratireducens]KAA5540642.1 hypothetical protein FYK55_19805 [Roseiconus nitratireducens]
MSKCVRRSILLCCALTAWLASSGYGQTVTLIAPGSDNRIATINGITINGTVYDVTFNHDIRYRDLPVPKLSFPGTSSTDYAAAVQAAETIASVVSGIPDVSGPTTSIFIAAGEGNGNRVRAAYIDSQPNYSDWSPADVLTGEFKGNKLTPSDVAWLTFSQVAVAVPEPSGFAMAAILAVIGLTRRHRPRLSKADLLSRSPPDAPARCASRNGNPICDGAARGRSSFDRSAP